MCLHSAYARQIDRLGPRRSGGVFQLASCRQRLGVVRSMARRPFSCPRNCSGASILCSSYYPVPAARAGASKRPKADCMGHCAGNTTCSLCCGARQSWRRFRYGNHPWYMYSNFRHLGSHLVLGASRSQYQRDSAGPVTHVDWPIQVHSSSTVRFRDLRGNGHCRS